MRVNLVHVEILHGLSAHLSELHLLVLRQRRRKLEVRRRQQCIANTS